MEYGKENWIASHTVGSIAFVNDVREGRCMWYYVLKATPTWKRICCSDSIDDGSKSFH